MPSTPPLRSFHPLAPGRAVHEPPTAGSQAWEVSKSDLTHRPFFSPPDHPPRPPHPGSATHTHTHTRSLIPEVRAFLHPSSRGDSAWDQRAGAAEEWMGRRAEVQGCPSPAFLLGGPVPQPWVRRAGLAWSAARGRRTVGQHGLGPLVAMLGRGRLQSWSWTYCPWAEQTLGVDQENTPRSPAGPLSLGPV